MVPMNIINIYENYNSYFNNELKSIFEQVSKIASRHSYKLYLIGGLVRDLLLDIKSLDIDITIEGNAIEFAKILEKEAGAKILSVHKDFGTVKVEIPIGNNLEKIDFASTRNEIYPRKGQLPVVEKIGCSLKEDVLRRDFTINSLAISLNQDDFANLVDYVNGFEDLKSKKIRVLHDKSFIDDPTRIIRALKYSSRLGFEIEGKTFKLQEEYLQNINYAMGYKRIKQEIKKTFDDCEQTLECKTKVFPERPFNAKNRTDVFNKFIEQGIYKLITNKSVEKPNINIENLINMYKPKHSWLVYLACIGLNEDIEKLALTKYEKEVIEGVKSLSKIKMQTDFEIYKAFNNQKIETLTILAILGKSKEVSHYINDLKKIKLAINGKDLIKLGLNPSKTFGEIFNYVLKQKLKNPIMKKTDEIEFVKNYIN